MISQTPREYSRCSGGSDAAPPQLLAVASGERTWAERHGLHNDLVLFNPAPVT